MTVGPATGIEIAMHGSSDPLNSVDLWDIALRLFAAIAVGIVIGIDREWRGKPVGIRTLALVSLGAALISLATIHLSALRNEPDAISRVVQGVIQGVMTGIGFIGAGAVLHRDKDVHGLTTAATVWVTAALGIAYALATWNIVLIGAGLTVFVLVILHPLDVWFDKRRADRSNTASKNTPPHETIAFVVLKA
jgi:putative Mg2+ transporter-C (MgtC) family protein